MQRKLIILIFALVLIPIFLAYAQDSRSTSKISFDFIDADIKNVLKILAEVSGKNIVIGDDVKGKVTIKIENMTWDEALDVILKNYALARIEDDKVIRVLTMKDYLSEKKRDRDERLEYLKEKEAKERLEEEFVTETLFINYVDAADMEKIVKGEASKDKRGRGLLSANGSVIPVKWTNSLIIKDTKENIELVKARIKEHDIPPSQVQIEARIVEASSDFNREFGIKWHAILDAGRSLTSAGAVGGFHSWKEDATFPKPDTEVIVPTPGRFTPAGSLALFIGKEDSKLQIDAILSALEAEGKGKIISNPKVVTLDNQPALIKQGTQIPYQTVSQSGTQTEFKDAVLSLEVTPHVTKDGNVSMKIKATKDKPVNLQGAFVPGIDKKEATTNVIVKDNETVVIGGIYEFEDNRVQDGIPFLRNIPLIGWLFFNYDKTQKKKSELLIFITPTIIKNKYQEVGLR